MAFAYKRMVSHGQILRLKGLEFTAGPAGVGSRLTRCTAIHANAAWTAQAPYTGASHPQHQPTYGLQCLEVLLLSPDELCGDLHQLTIQQLYSGHMGQVGKVTQAATGGSKDTRAQEHRS
jgi:hypothetical protein